jgi:hypothetical protein
MKGLLVVTMLIMILLVILPPERSSEVNRVSDSQAADLHVFTAVAMVFTGLRDLMYGIGEAAVTISAGLWQALPERLKPIVGMLILGNSALALLGLLVLSGASRLWDKILK